MGWQSAFTTTNVPTAGLEHSLGGTIGRCVRNDGVNFACANIADGHGNLLSYFEDFGFFSLFVYGSAGHIQRVLKVKSPALWYDLDEPPNSDNELVEAVFSL